jgi:hypothetical protein
MMAPQAWASDPSSPFEVGEVPAPLPGRLDHLGKGIGWGQAGVAGVEGEQLHAPRAVHLLEPVELLTVGLDAGAPVVHENKGEDGVLSKRREVSTACSEYVGGDIGDDQERQCPRVTRDRAGG